MEKKQKKRYGELSHTGLQLAALTGLGEATAARDNLIVGPLHADKACLAVLIGVAVTLAIAAQFVAATISTDGPELRGTGGDCGEHRRGDGGDGRRGGVVLLLVVLIVILLLVVLIVVLPLETSACVQAGLDGDGGGSNNGHEGEGAVHHGSGVSLVFKGTVGVCWGDAVL